MAGIATIVVTELITELTAAVTSFLQEEYTLVANLQEEVTNLKSNLVAIRAILSDAERKQVENESIRNWLENLKDAALDAEDILKTYATEEALWKQKVRKTKLPFKYNAAHKIKEISARFNQISEQKNNFLLLENFGQSYQAHISHSNTNETGSFVDPSDIVGRVDDKKKIIEMLCAETELDRQNIFSVVTITGMGGLGKSTLAQLVFNDDKVKDIFDSRMWVSVTAQFDLKRILRDAIEYDTGMTLDEKLSRAVLEKRFLEFLRGKRFLLVLDDVWTDNPETWKPLKALLKQGKKGSRVLVTARNTNVSNIMYQQPPYQLEFLPEPECQTLFDRIAFENIDLNQPNEEVQELREVGIKIVSKCGSLPLGVRAMAGLLRGNLDLNKWEEILSSNIWEGSSDILPFLEISYVHLPFHLRRCFEYCSIFPKSFVFDKKALVNIWMAQAFIESRQGMRTEDIGISYFHELIVRSFIQTLMIDGEEKYKMHDLIHDLAQSVSSRYCCQVVDEGNCNITETSRHVSLLYKNIKQHDFGEVIQSKKLRSLVLPNVNLEKFTESLEKIFNELVYIRVLDLSSSTLLELPESIENLKLLHYLDLSKTEIKSLPNSICNLYNLQTLKLLGCMWLFNLPKDLGKLLNLRHLELDDLFWFNFSVMPTSMGNSKFLHNLHKFCVGRERGTGIEELENMAYLTGTLHISKLENAMDGEVANLKGKKSLDEVLFEWSNTDIVEPEAAAAHEKVLGGLQPHPNIKKLGIFHYQGSAFPAWMRGRTLKNLVFVSLNHCMNCRILPLAELPRLQQLFIKGMQELEEWPGVTFRYLDTLKIGNCHSLKEFPDDPNILPNLRVLRIKKCGSLKALPVTPSLQFLILTNNPLLEDWRECRLELVGTQHGVPIHAQTVSLTNVLELKIIGCPKLPGLPRYFAPQKLDISGCDLVTTLQFNAARLQHLLLENCADGRLVMAIPDTDTLYSLVISNISNISSIPIWPNLPGLKALYIRKCKDLVSISSSLQNLNSLSLLSIRDCPNLQTILSEEAALPNALECLSICLCPSLQSIGHKEILTNLTALSDLYIEDCPMLQCLPVSELPRSLKHLHIQGCPLLMEQCREDGQGSDWQKIRHIPDMDIEAIQESPPPNDPNQALLPSTWYHCFTCCLGIDARQYMLGNNNQISN